MESQPQTYPLVDWISFSVSAPQNPKKTEVQWLDRTNVKLCRRQATQQVYNLVGREVMDTLFSSLPVNEDIGRFPYKYSLIDDLTSARIMFDSGLDHIGIEISGKGCRALQEGGHIQRLLAVVSNNCSRVDVSLDVLTNTSPIEFCEAGWEGRFTSHATHVSDVGTTVYVGSPKSEKRAAIYRYNTPHPRAQFLRLEHRFRNNFAKHMCNYISVNGLAMGAAYAGLQFGWKHPLWSPQEVKELPLPKLAGDARDAAFARWLMKQVFPAMRRAEREGQIDDLRAFVQTHLFEDEADTEV